MKHPTKKFVWVSECGSVFDAREMKVLKTKVSNWGYHRVIVNGETLLIHTLVCEMFHGKAPKSDMVANHIDGDKSNNHKDNLEWATKSENLIHAYKSGLRSDNRPILIKDLASGKIDEFYSMQETSRFLECTAENIYRWLNAEKNAPFKNKYDVRYDDTNFKGFTVGDIGKVVNGMPRKVLLTDRDGNLSIYGTLALAASVIGCNRETVRRHIHRTKNLSPMGEKGYTAQYLDEYKGTVPEGTPYTPYVEPIKIVPVRKPTPIEVTDLKTGDVKIYASTEEFAKLLGLNKSTVQKATMLKNWCGKSIKYIRDEQVIKI